MKKKIIICGLLVLMVLFSGCTTKEEREEQENCLTEIAKKYSEENNLTFDEVFYSPTSDYFKVKYGIFREDKLIDFTREELESCGAE